MPPKQLKPRQKKASKQKAKGRSTQTAPAVPQLKLVLHHDREEARKDKEGQYSWAKTRQQMEDDIKNCTDGKILRYYQEHVGEAFALGLDSALIAPTGAGKTMAFAAALAADETKTSKILIISTLNERPIDNISDKSASAFLLRCVRPMIPVRTRASIAGSGGWSFSCRCRSLSLLSRSRM